MPICLHVHRACGRKGFIRGTRTAGRVQNVRIGFSMPMHIRAWCVQAAKGRTDERAQTLKAEQLQHKIDQALGTAEAMLQQGRTALQGVSQAQLKDLQVTILLHRISLPVAALLPTLRDLPWHLHHG